MSIIKLNNVRLAFADIFEPAQFDEKSALKYGAAFLVPKNSPYVLQIQNAIKEVAAAKWGAKSEALLKSFEGNPNKYCFMDGDARNYDGYEGNWALSSKASARPLVLDRDKTPLTQSDGRPYPGCYVNASVEIWAQDNKWGKGIRASLRGLQFYKDGDAFAGGRPADVEEFDDLSEGSEETLA